MTFDWYKIFNLDEFLATQLVSRKLTVVLDGRGEKEILITSGNDIGVMFEDTFMILNFNDENPYVREGDDDTYALYVDSSDDVWLGIEVAET